jgi:hypothetical protein
MKPRSSRGGVLIFYFVMFHFVLFCVTIYSPSVPTERLRIHFFYHESYSFDSFHFDITSPVHLTLGTLLLLLIFFRYIKNASSYLSTSVFIFPLRCKSLLLYFYMLLLIRSSYRYLFYS